MNAFKIFEFIIGCGLGAAIYWSIYSLFHKWGKEMEEADRTEGRE